MEYTTTEHFQHIKKGLSLQCYLWTIPTSKWIQLEVKKQYISLFHQGLIFHYIIFNMLEVFSSSIFHYIIFNMLKVFSSSIFHYIIFDINIERKVYVKKEKEKEGICTNKYNIFLVSIYMLWLIGVLTPTLAIFQIYHGVQCECTHWLTPNNLVKLHILTISTFSLLNRGDLLCQELRILYEKFPSTVLCRFTKHSNNRLKFHTFDPHSLICSRQ
jgi:hypothetical protein